MGNMKPILFNTNMVRAIMSGNKTVTRRAIKFEFADLYKAACFHGKWYEGFCTSLSNCPESLIEWYVRKGKKPPYHPGDTMWVRETWMKDISRYMYKADYGDGEKFYRDGNEIIVKWRPSIHMPREAARLFLRVTDVRVERLQDITDEQVEREGIRAWTKDGKLYKYAPADREGDYPTWEWADCPKTPRDAMIRLWDSTINPTDFPRFSFAANPWVWVIEFKRISKEEATT